MEETQKDQTPSQDNLKKTAQHTFDEQSTVGTDGGGVGSTSESWGGELPTPKDWDLDEQHAETD